MSTDALKDINFDVIKDTYIDCLKKFLVFNGRSRRREFWIFCLVNFVLGIIPAIGWIVALVTFIPSLAVAVRRFHDTNRSGKWLLWGFVPPVVLLIGGVATIFSHGGSAFMVFLVIVIIGSIGMLVIYIIWCVQDGTPGDNQYGPNPKESSGAAVTAQPGAPVGKDKSTFCGKCGAKNASGAKFCVECGKPLA